MYIKCYFAECKHLLAKVLERCANEIIVVNKHKTVVRIGKFVNVNRPVLRIMLLNIQFKACFYFLRIYARRNIILPLIKHLQYGVVNIVVNQDYPFLSTANQVAGKLIGVKYLSIEEYALNRWQRSMYKKNLSCSLFRLHAVPNAQTSGL